MQLYRLVSAAACAACLVPSFAIPARHITDTSKEPITQRQLPASESSLLGGVPLPVYHSRKTTSSDHKPATKTSGLEPSHSKNSTGKGGSTGHTPAPTSKHSTGAKHGSTTSSKCAIPTYGISGPTMGKKVNVTTTSACNGKLPSGFTPIPAPTGAGTNWINAPKSAAECHDPKDPNKKCWDDLHLVDFARWWWDRNKDSCASNKPDSMGFADCFYVRATPYAPVQCDKLQANPYCQKPDWADFQSYWMPETHFYLAWTIFNLNSFIHNYYESVGSAGSKAGEAIGKAVTLIDPVQTLNTKAHTIITILTSAMYLIPGAGDPVAGEFLALAQQSVSIQNLLYPVKTIDTQFATFADVGAGLEKLTSNYQSHLADTLYTVEGNVTSFLEMTKGGIFTGFIGSLTSMDEAMTQALLTYVISESFKSKGAFIGVAPNTNVQQLANNGTKLNWDVSCDKYDSNSMCGVHYYDDAGKTTLSLAGVPKADDWGSILDTLMNDLKYTTPTLLFGTKSFCSDHSTLKLANGDPYDPCISDFKKCTWNMDIDYHNPLGPQVFTDCNVGTYLKSPTPPSCNADWAQNGGIDLPGAYLGGMLTMGGQPKRSDTCVINYDHGQDNPPDPPTQFTGIARRRKRNAQPIG